MPSKKRATDVVDDNEQVATPRAADAATIESEAADTAVQPTDADSGNSSTSSKPDASQAISEADPFDPESLRLSQKFASGLGVKKQLMTMPVRKPSKEKWIRVHPDEEYRLQTMVLELKDEREVYLIDPDFWPTLASESTVSARTLLTAIDRQGALFLWPVRLPGPNGKVDNWSRSSLEGAELATKQWVRIAANMDVGAYDVFTTSAPLPEPEWPDVQFRELLKIAFKDRFIDSLDHPVLKRLMGKA